MYLPIAIIGYMAYWHFFHRARQVFLTCLMMLLLIPAKSQTILIRWDFEDENQVADAGIAINAGREITTNTTGTINYTEGSKGSGSNSISCRKWNNGQDLKCWQTNLSTAGYKNLSLSSKQRSSDRGPRDFKIQYSLDEQLWVDVGITISVGNNFTSGVIDHIELPNICSNQPILYIRWLVSSNSDVVGTIIDSNGTSRIDDIEVEGCLIPALTSPLSHITCSGTIVNYIPTGNGSVFDWNRPSVSGITEVANSGSGVIGETLTSTTILPIEVTYSYQLNLEGCTNSQNVIITVNPTPDLIVSPSGQQSCPSANIQPISFSNPNELPETTFSWIWTEINTDILIINPSNGTSSPITATVNSSLPETMLETSFKVTATSPLGCSVSQLVAISIGDTVSPTFSEHTDTISFCVDDITIATSNGMDDISEPRPEYYTLNHSDQSLDLSSALFSDNCTPNNELILHWQIDFYQNSIPMTGSGQPSLTSSAIVFPCSSERVINHKITYWLEDKYGNIMPISKRAVIVISIHPRPNILQNF